MLTLDAIDALDGTPVIDIKPYFASIDAFPEATSAGQSGADGRATHRQRAIAKALTALLPLAPYIDAEKIRADAYAPHLKTLPPSTAVWLATVAHVRHAHTDYEKLLGEGYDRDSARFFVIDEINEVLTRWRATRLLDPDDEEI